MRKPKKTPGKLEDVPPIVPSPAATTVTGDHNVAVVAQIACQLLRGSDYASAVSRALSLLDECVTALSHRTQRLANTDGEVDAASSGATAPLPWEEFMRHVTGESRIDRAEIKLLDAVKLRIQAGRAARVFGNAADLPLQPTLAQWRRHLRAVPKTTTEEARAHMAQLRQLERVPVFDVQSYRGLFARYYPLHKALTNAESSRIPSKRGKKRGRPARK